MKFSTRRCWVGPKIEHCVNQISKQLSLHQKQPCITLGGFGYVTMDAGIQNTSTKSKRDIAVLQPSDQKPNQHNVNSDTAMSQLVHTGLMCSEISQRCILSQLSLSLFLRVTKSIPWSH